MAYIKRMAGVLLMISVIFYTPDTGNALEDHGFRFIRIQFDDLRGGYGGFRRGGPSWMHDYPTAEENLYEALRRTTKIDIAGQYMILSLKDERIFEYPFLYLCEPGFWVINNAEIDNLKEYFARGGFIMFDDFRGQREWMNFYFNMKQVFPEKEPQEVLPDHPIWTIYYDIDPVEAPSWVSGRYGRYDDRYFAYFDEDGRMMSIICFNQDIGDGWEWPGERLDEAKTVPFQMGINFIMYALTH